MNECGACGLDFGSLAAFDAHRVGKHEYLFAEGAVMDPPRYDGRRCLAESEIEEALDRHGNYLFARNAFGKWSLRSRLESAREAFPDDIGSPEGVS